MAIGQSIASGLSYKANKAAAKDTRRANADLTRRMEQSRGDYLARRPEAAEERMRALRAQLTLLGPQNRLAQEMGGGDPGYALDFGEVSKSPLAMTPLQSQMTKRDASGSQVLGTNGQPIPISVMDRARLAGQGYNVPAEPVSNAPGMPGRRTVK